MTIPEPGPSEDDAVPFELSASWEQAEARLYPAITTRPDLYQRSLTVVARTVERLRLLGPSTQALVDAHGRGGGLVAEVLTAHGLPAHELDPGLLARAALAMRHREVVAEQAALHRQRLLAQALREGIGWVTVEERGDHAGDPFVPYSRLEVEAATGRALLVSARGDDEFRSVVHAVEELQVDLDTGAVDEPAEGGLAPALHPDSTARERDVAARKASDRSA